MRKDRSIQNKDMNTESSAILFFPDTCLVGCAKRNISWLVGLAKRRYNFVFVCFLFCLLVEPFTPMGHLAFFMGAGLPFCVLFVLEPFTPMGHKAFFMGAGLPYVYFMCFVVLRLLVGTHGPGAGVA